jgi:hypothetical protein
MEICTANWGATEDPETLFLVGDGFVELQLEGNELHNVSLEVSLSPVGGPSDNLWNEAWYSNLAHFQYRCRG